MQFRIFASLVCIITCDGLTLRNEIADQSVEHLALAAERIALLEAEADDRRFWTAALAAQEAELLQLQAVAEQNVSTPRVAAKFTSATNTSIATSVVSNKSALVTQEKPHHDHHKSPLAGVKLNLNPKSAADLIPALAMLKAMYEDGKERIGQLNVREKKLKDKYAEKEAAHKDKLVSIAANFKNGKLNQEFYTNETRDENRMWKYWEGCRARQHKQFHTSLKIQHATMSKEKTMVDMYEKTISGKADGKQIEKELVKASGGGMPEIVLFQAAWRDTANYCHGALDELRTASSEFLHARDAAADRAFA